ncbi:hypothetical protein M422DRAFT_189782, partial [Sphaerobolus stellatus SS14]
YVLKSDSLLLVTIIEAVCADGTTAAWTNRGLDGCRGTWWVRNNYFYFYMAILLTDSQKICPNPEWLDR